MEISLNKGFNRNFLPNNSGYCKKNKMGFSANPLAAIGPEKLMKKIPNSFWKKLVDKIPEKLYSGNFAKNILEKASSNPAVVEAAFVLGLCLTLRPGAIMATPGAPIEDRKYAAAKSIATGILGFIITAAVFIPIAAATKNLGKLAAKGFPAVDSPRYKAAEYLFNYVPKFILAPIEATALFAMVPPIVHKILDKKKVPSQPENSVNPSSKGSV